MESNLEVLRKVINNKLHKDPASLVGRQRREREKKLQEVAKEYIGNFQSLSKVYFKQVGDEYLSTEFSDLISEHALKELAKLIQTPSDEKSNHLERGCKFDSPSEQPPTKAINLGKMKPSMRTNSLLSTSSVKDFRKSHPKKPSEEKPLDNPLADIKSQIGNIEEFIKSYVQSEEEMENRKQDIVKLEDEKKGLVLRIQELKNQIVSRFKIV